MCVAYSHMGNFHIHEHKFNTYQECNQYIQEHIEENIYTPTGQAIGLTYCKPVDTDK